MKSLAKNTVFNILYTISNLLFLFVTSAYGSRVLLAEGIGRVAYAKNIASYFVMFAALGLPTYGIREIAKARLESQEQTNKTYTELFLINLLSTIVFTSIYLLLISLVPSFRADIPLYLCFGLQIAINCINIDWLYKGHEEYSFIAIASMAVKLISLLVCVCFVKTREDYLLYAIITVFAGCGNYIFNIVYSRKYVKFDFKDLSFKKHISPLLILVVSLFLSSIYSKVDITMLGSMCSDETVGLYYNAHQAAEIVICICTSISAVFLPQLSYAYKNDYKHFLNLIDLGVRVLLFVAIPASAGVCILAPQLIQLVFGSSFALASNTLRIFSLLIIIKSFGNLLCYQLVIATGNEKQRLPAYFAAATINVILNFVLIPKMAQNGAAIASVISELIVNGVQVVAMLKIIKIPFSKSAFWQSILSTIVMSAGVVGICVLLDGLFLETMVAVLVGAALYFTMNIIMKNKFVADAANKFFRKKGSNI